MRAWANLERAIYASREAVVFPRELLLACLVMRVSFLRRGARLLAVLLATAPTLASSPAAAQEGASGASRVFWAGPSAGEPSAAKRATLLGFYGAAVLSGAFTAYSGYSWARSSQEEASLDVHGACYDLTSPDCRTLVDAREATRDFSRLTAGGAAATSALLLSGILVAQYWDNVVLRLDLESTGVSARWVASF